MPKPAKAPFDRLSYYANRNERMISFYPEDIKDKETLATAAAADGGRSLNAWLLLHVLPVALEIAKAQLAKAEADKKGGKHLRLVRP